jgi:hypothetical protein
MAPLWEPAVLPFCQNSLHESKLAVNKAEALPPCMMCCVVTGLKHIYRPKTETAGGQAGSSRRGGKDTAGGCEKQASQRSRGAPPCLLCTHDWWWFCASPRCPSLPCTRRCKYRPCPMWDPASGVRALIPPPPRNQQLLGPCRRL